MKYYNAMVVFEEIPNEITLAINITNCPCHCKGCHSKFLWEDVGTELDGYAIDDLVKKNNGVTCVCFMGGDSDPTYIDKMAAYVKYGLGLKVGWYSGRDFIDKFVDLTHFDYVKIGRYDEELGGLNKETTNQRLYSVVSYEFGKDKHYKLEDITKLFWKKAAK